MLKSFFSFLQRKALSFRSAQKIMIRALKAKEQHAALYLKYARALKPYSSRQAAIFTKMGMQELENYKQLLCLSCNNRARTVGSLCDHPALVTSKRASANACTITPSANAHTITSSANAHTITSSANTHTITSSANTHTIASSANTHTIASGGNVRTIEVKKQTPKKPSKTHKQMLLTWIQPGLAGLMDGSVSTLAPIFAAAFATEDTHQTFLIGLSASIGAGLSMGFTEAAHDDGKLSGRGSPLKRGIASGVMTTLGGLGHTLPYLINSFYIATIIAFIIVFFELLAIVWIQNKFMSTPFWRASLQVIIGGALVFATGVFIGSI
ncbi:VIT1/CCC1 transporter family protein [Bartonella refiksaydamii]|uniref:VIT1/CCC1 transporter family protein n=1 Tax=Bartonella refiksaydamii TaxID=2654951 RepID=UPI0012EB2494|nr:VIT1/CCC1 transporter family protein [Bartonella refiksaydamii]